MLNIFCHFFTSLGKICNCSELTKYGQWIAGISYAISNHLSELKERARKCKRNQLYVNFSDKTVGTNFCRFFNIPKQCFATENNSFLGIFYIFLLLIPVCLNFNFLFLCILLISTGFFYVELLKVSMCSPFNEFQTSNEG